MINMDFVKEIADRYGIGIEVIEEGKSGFIIDETGKVYDNFSKKLINVLKKTIIKFQNYVEIVVKRSL